MLSILNTNQLLKALFINSYCHLLKDYFVLESKHSWLYATQISYRTAIANVSVSEEILTHMYIFSFIYMSAKSYWVLCSVHTKSFTLCAWVVNSRLGSIFCCFYNIYIYIYIYIIIMSRRLRGYPDRLSPFLPIIHRLRQVFRVTSRVLT